MASPVVTFAAMQCQNRYTWSLPDRSHIDRVSTQLYKAQGILARIACLDTMKPRYSLDIPVSGPYIMFRRQFEVRYMESNTQG